MTPWLVPAILALLWTAVATAGEVTPGRAIDLNGPGVLGALQRSNPMHYEKVREILEGVLERPDPDVPRWIQATFNGRDVKYTPIVLTSYPPQRRLSFTLDTTRYKAVIVLTHVRGDIVPAK